MTLVDSFLSTFCWNVSFLGWSREGRMDGTGSGDRVGFFGKIVGNLRQQLLMQGQLLAGSQICALRTSMK